MGWNDLLSVDLSAVNEKKPRKSDKQYPAEDIKANALASAGLLADFAPVYGSGKAAKDEYDKGNYGMAALNGAGSLFDVATLGSGAFLGAIKKGKNINIPVSQDIYKRLGKQELPVRANPVYLHGKHSDQFDSPEDLLNSLNYTMSGDGHTIIPATHPDYTLIAKDSSGMPVPEGFNHRAVIVDFEKPAQGNYYVKSTHILRDDQLGLKEGKIGASGSVPVSEVNGPVVGMNFSGRRPARATASAPTNFNISLQRQLGNDADPQLLGYMAGGGLLGLGGYSLMGDQ